MKVITQEAWQKKINKSQKFSKQNNDKKVENKKEDKEAQVPKNLKVVKPTKKEEEHKVDYLA